MPSSPNTSSNNLGRSLYRRILRELKATRNYDHHLRDIRFLLWVPGTQGKRKFDALKQLAEKSASLHPRRGKRSASIAAAAVATAPRVEGTSAASSTPSSSSPPPPSSSSSPSAPEPKNPNPTIADQIRAVARELFNHHAKMHEKFVSTSSSTAAIPPGGEKAPITAEHVKLRAAAAAKRVKLLQEGTARAFWAIKRMQDVREGIVPTASMWLTGPQRAKFDPFSSLRESHLRSGAFPFLPEFLGVDENLVLASPDEEEEAVIAQAVEGLETSSSCSSKTLRLAVVSRCAAKDGASARYHISFRLENTARDAALDIKLAHLFAVNCEEAPVLTEMVCSLPFLGNSILRPNPDPAAPQFSFSPHDDEDDGGGEEEEQDKEEEEEDDDVNVNADDDDDDDDAGEGGNNNADEKAEGKSTDLKTTASLLPSAGGAAATSPPRDTFTAKANTPDHCAVYDVTFPVQGECVLRGVVFYRVITNSNSSSGAAGGGGGSAPTTVKSRLKALHFPPIRLTSKDPGVDDDDDDDDEN